MLFSPSVILEKIRNDFGTVNQSFSGFPDSGSLWDECVRTVKDATLMNHIIFNNDVMEIPPVRTFLKANRVLEGGFNTYQKKALDAFWVFVFRDIFFYADQENNARVDVLGIRKGTRFTNPQSDVIVGDLDEASGKIIIPVPRQRLRRNLTEPGSATLHPASDGQRVDDSMTTEKRIDDSTIADHRSEDERIDARRLENQRIEDQRMEGQSIEAHRLENQRIEDHRTSDQRIADHRIPDERIQAPYPEDQRVAEQRITEQRIDNQRDADRMIEEQRIEQQRMEDQRIRDQRTEEQQTAEDRIEAQKIGKPRV